MTPVRWMVAALGAVILLALAAGSGSAAEAPAPTCRILFLAAPDGAPKKLHLFDGVDSQEVELPRLNLSPVYRLRPAPLRLFLLPGPPADPEQLPAGAPFANVAEGTGDFYLLVTSDPSNRVAPVRMQVIRAGAQQLKRGQMLWLNLTKATIAGVVGSEKLTAGPRSRVILDPPSAAAGGYPVRLAFRNPGDERVYPLCETSWIHQPGSRSLALILPEPGRRTPRVQVFRDHRAE